jgi:hypothetical protein
MSAENMYQEILGNGREIALATSAGNVPWREP